MRTPQDIVQSEVLVCLSSLVSTLAQAYGMGIPGEPGDLADLADQAFDVACPCLDYEDAAREAGWTDDPHGRFPIHRAWQEGEREDNDAPCVYADSWQEACGFDSIEPHEREVFEHWAVTDWLADKLIAQGEKVDKDFAGMCVWARTTTGQAIHADGVIERIAAELAA